MSDYIKDPNNSKKQIPGPPPDNAFDRVKTFQGENPGSGSSLKPPHSVYVNKLITGDNLSFFFGSSASYAALEVSEGGNESILSGSQHYANFGKVAAGTTLNIHPSAFSCSLADSGSVTFIYKGGLDGQGRW